MTDAPQGMRNVRRWFRLTPDRVVLALLAVEVLLILSECFGWFPFNRHKGWTLVIGLAVVIAAVLLMFLWFLAALIFRWRFQYSIRSLLLLTLVVAMVCSWLAVAERQARKQREVVEEIRRLGGDVLYDYQLDPSGNEMPGATQSAPTWLRKVLGDDLLTDVTTVLHGRRGAGDGRREIGDADLEHLKELRSLQCLGLELATVSDAGLEHLRELNQLKTLNLLGTHVTDAGLECLKGLRQLQWLDLNYTTVSDAGLRHLKGLVQLQSLHLSGTKVSGAGLEYLRGLTRLQCLDVSATKLGDSGLEHLRGLTEMQELDLGYTRVSDLGLKHLQGLPRLERLNLRRTMVSDAGLCHLRGMTQLRWLELTGTAASDAGVRDLQQALPNLQLGGPLPSAPILARISHQGE